jgi:hypothetical protein
MDITKNYTEKGAKATIVENEEANSKPAAPAGVVDTSFPNLDDQRDTGDDDETVLSNMLMTCMLFIVHSVTNAFLLSGWNPTRCLFW